MKRPIAISLAPNLEGIDVLLALKLLFSPFSWFNGGHVKAFEQWFREYFEVFYAVSFASARGALIGVLKSAGIQQGDEVILQAFTCVAVPNAAIAVGGKPVYVDIDSAFTLDVEDFERKITKKTKAIIVQHTFGIAADMKKIRFIAKKHNLFVIEDCAHVIGGMYEGKKLGTLGDAAIFSFGRDKAFSSVFGGVAITNKEELGKKIRQFQKTQDYPSIFWIFQQLFHPVAFFLILPLYNFFSIGKILLLVLQKVRLLSFPVLPLEKQGKTDEQCLKKMPNPLAKLAFFQLKKIEVFNKKRKELAKIYAEILGGRYIDGTVYLRYPFLVEKRDSLFEALKKKGVYIGKWYSEVVDPKGTNFANIFYQKGSCLNAERLAKKVINLPTYPTMTRDDAKKTALLIKQYVANT